MKTSSSQKVFTALLTVIICSMSLTLTSCDINKKKPAGVQKTNIEFVLVKGGCYKMGDVFNDTGIDDERPVHEVCVDDFYLGKYEVTQRQWKEIMGKNPSGFQNGDNYPVENVSWEDAQVFIKKLNEKDGTKYRLPTEAEWEFAARERGRAVRFATGKNTIDEKAANFDARTTFKMRNSEVELFRGATTPVGSFNSNELGLYDMSGNVWEWVQDVYSPFAYKHHQKKNPVNTRNDFSDFEKEEFEPPFTIAALCSAISSDGYKLTFDSTDFDSDDFKKPFTVSALVNAIRKDNDTLALKAETGTVEWLNELLTVPNYYDLLRRKKKYILYSKAFKKLEQKTRKLRGKDYADLQDDEQAIIKQFNKSLLRETYSGLTPVRLTLNANENSLLRLNELLKIPYLYEKARREKRRQDICKRDKTYCRDHQS